MSSGEADAYTYTIRSNAIDNTYPYYPWTSQTTNSFVYTTSKDRYFYQITCPRCKTLNWAELDTTITCARKGKPCGARIKAVSEVVDYEVAIER